MPRPLARPHPPLFDGLPASRRWPRPTRPRILRLDEETLARLDELAQLGEDLGLGEGRPSHSHLIQAAVELAWRQTREEMEG